MRKSFSLKLFSLLSSFSEFLHHKSQFFVFSLSVCVFSFYASVDVFEQRLLFFWVINFHYIWFISHDFWNSSSSVGNDSRSCELLCRMIWAIAFEMLRGFIINAELLFIILFNCFFWNLIDLWLFLSIHLSSSYTYELPFHLIWKLSGSDCNCWMLSLLCFFMNCPSLKFLLI